MPFDSLSFAQDNLLQAELVEAWCHGAELNHRHKDFQSSALPLSYRGLKLIKLLNVLYFLLLNLLSLRYGRDIRFSKNRLVVRILILKTMSETFIFIKVESNGGHGRTWTSDPHIISVVL